MSDALAIAAVTAVLQYYLHNLYSNLDKTEFGSTVSVTAVAPDIIQAALSKEGSEQNQINIFLHQVTHNAAWRNAGQPSLAGDGKTLLSDPPLALDLHYLLTAYGNFDWQAEALLGYALLFLHQYPVIARSDIASALSNLSNSGLPKLATLVGQSGLADQIERIKVTPATLGREEMAWLWTALKADYRPTYPFQASVVLMQKPRAKSVALPVRKVNIQALPITPAQILNITPPKGQAAPLPGDKITIEGIFLGGASRLLFVNQRLGISATVALTAADVTNTEIKSKVPNNSANFPAGIYSVTVQFLDSTGKVARTTNTVSLAVAPAFDPSSVKATANKKGTLVTLTCDPYAWVSQDIYFTVANLPSANPAPISAPAVDFAAKTNSLSFQFSPALAAGPGQLAMLQVDEVSSLLTWTDTTNPPAFTAPLVTI